MSILENIKVESAPRAWLPPCQSKELRLHQLAPYIGKLKSSIAETLISTYTKAGDVVLDPFCGSGTIPLECVRAGRRVIAADCNPYAVVLTQAKLNPPDSLTTAIGSLVRCLAASRARRVDLNTIPKWVLGFFHPYTLREALAFADECIDEGEFFLLSCLLGILHHQRPGFLSFPSSHLVPYLRERKYSRTSYPEMYEYRALAERMEAKVRRIFRTSGAMPNPQLGQVVSGGIEHLIINEDVDAIITSPPYMNALDYIRDNRLRMWFLDRRTLDYSPEPTDRRQEFARLTLEFVSRALVRLRPGGMCVLVVGETVRRKRMTSHPADRMLTEIMSRQADLELVRVIGDSIPDVRRTRRTATATKRELILVLRRRERRSDNQEGVCVSAA